MNAVPVRRGRSGPLVLSCLCVFLLCAACAQRTQSVTRYDDGTPCAEIAFLGRALDGPYVLHHAGGHVELESRYSGGLREGSYTAWHANGQCAVRGQYAHGLRVGLWQEWSESGVLISSGEYVAGDKHGTWRLFDADGRPAAEDTWDTGTRLSRRYTPAPAPPPEAAPR